jgi:hypothetical protein
METNESVNQTLKWWQYLSIGLAMLVVGFGITNTFADTSVMWNVGAGIQLIAWGFVITSVIKGVKNKRK